MPKGVAKKPDVLKAGETVSVQKDVATADTLSTVDVGHDFVKQGEVAQIGRGK